MKRRSLLTLGLLLGLVGLPLLQFGSAAPPPEGSGSPTPGKLPTLKDKSRQPLNKRLAEANKMKPEDVEKFMKSLGEFVRDDLKNGDTIALPGLGVFRVVRLEEHKDLKDGRPVTIPAVNVVEFLPTNELNQAANSETARPAEVVPRYEFATRLSGESGQREPLNRTPGGRTKP